MTRIAGLALAGLTLAGPVAAQDAVAKAIEARQSQMHLYAFNLGQLGAMAKGAIEYNADQASAAAGNLALLSTLNAGAMWVPGSDSMSVANTRALPDLWDNMADVGAKAQALAEAAAAMNDAAGNGLEALQAAMGPLGGACGGCHKVYRAPE
ncbi:MAG: cytochrome c [Rhodobacteraceae bacterium]|nr:cytochrome c [Paracoccaceae bacterium]